MSYFYWSLIMKWSEVDKNKQAISKLLNIYCNLIILVKLQRATTEVTTWKAIYAFEDRLSIGSKNISCNQLEVRLSHKGNQTTITRHRPWKRRNKVWRIVSQKERLSPRCLQLQEFQWIRYYAFLLLFSGKGCWVRCTQLHPAWKSILITLHRVEREGRR